MGAVDKRIAEWLGVSMPTYYRWRRAGLLPRRPESVSAALEMRARIDEARDAAVFVRPPGQQGRTRLATVAKAFGVVS